MNCYLYSEMLHYVRTRNNGRLKNRFTSGSILLALMVVSIQVIRAQAPPEGKSFQEGDEVIMLDSIPPAAHDYLVHLYDTMVNRPDNMDLSGKEYEIYYSVESTPLLPKSRYPDGTLTIGGRHYSGLMLQYDTYLDAVVYFPRYRQIYRDVNAIIINTPAIDAFDPGIPGRKMQFRYFNFPDTTGTLLKSGLYEVVYDGSCQYLKKYSSIIFIEEGKKLFKIKEQRFILNEDRVYRITGRKSVLKALHDKMPEVKKYIRSQDMIVRGAENGDMVKILTFYDDAKTR